MKYLGLAILFVFIFSNALGQKVSYDEIENVRIDFEKQNQISGSLYSSYPILNNLDTLAIIYNYPIAFIVISTKKELPPIKAYSTSNNIDISTAFDKTNPISFYNLLKDDLSQFIKHKELNQKFVLINNKSWQNIRSYNTSTTKAQVGPLLPSLYGQVNCKNENNSTINVTNIFTPNNYAVGCVAITFVEILQYFQWPRIGIGSHSYTDNQGSSTGTYSANFESKYYNWNNILDEYHHKSSSSTQRTELGNITYHCAVSVNMEFEYNGSTSNVNKIPSAANKHFRYTAEYITKSTSQFWNRIDENILSGLPIQFPIYTSSGAGHAIVCDGIKDIGQPTQYYHLNMGWWGSSNGWYDIQNGFNAGGYSNITGAVLDMIPIPELASPSINADKNTIEIEWFYSQQISPEAYELQVKDGNNNWQTIDNDIQNTNYSYTYTSTDLHRFRIRAKYNGNWEDDGWSNYESIDIQQALNDYYPENIVVIPTIVYDKLTIEYKYLSGSTLSIYSMQGALVYRIDIGKDDTSGKLILNIMELQKGTYILQVAAEEATENVKIIKI